MVSIPQPGYSLASAALASRKPPPTSLLTRVPGAAPCRRVGCRELGRGVSVGLPFGVPLRGCLGRLTIFGIHLGLLGTGNIFFHMILALGRVVVTPTAHALVILGHFSGMSQGPVNLFLLTRGQALGGGFVVPLARLAVSPRPATPGRVAAPPSCLCPCLCPSPCQLYGQECGPDCHPPSWAWGSLPPDVPFHRSSGMRP